MQRGSAGNTGTAEASTYYYHSDHLGSAHLITDYKGDEYERVEYTPYGEYWIEKSHAAGIMKSLFFTSFAEQNSVSNCKVASFTGKERDEARTIAGVLCVGLYYYGARYLDAKTSRWLTTDPALSDYIPMAPVNDEAKKHNENLPGGGIYNTFSTHLYNYANNNPIKYKDPDGRAPQVAIGAVLGLSFLVLATYYTALNYYQNPEVQEGNKQLADSLLLGIDSAKDVIRDALSKSKSKKKSGLDAANQADISSPLIKTDRDINDTSNPDEWPLDPDDWEPPSDVHEEEKTRDATNGEHRQWKDKDGNIVRRWDKSGREGGRDRGPHWHDKNGNHILPGGEIDN